MMFTMSLYHRGCSKICSTQLKQVESVAYLNVTLYNKMKFLDKQSK